MRIAYLVNQYPKISHSFIRREILALERLDFEVVRIALRGWADELADEEDRIERTRTRYVLHKGAAALLLALARVMITRPASFFSALTLACQMGYRADRPLFVHLIYLAEACYLEAWLRNAGVQHLHAHFGTNPAEVAMLVHSLGGPHWSFTVHGPEEFDKPSFIGLVEKVRHCSFVVGVSSYTRSQLYRWAPPQYWSKIHVVHCGLDGTYFSRPAITVPTVRRLICVGRLCEQKGQLLLVEAAHQLTVQGLDFELVLAGDGDMRGAIERRIADLNLQARVRITGWISGDKVSEEVLAARALVLPSFAEGLPVVIMEAMALRRPIISSFVAGVPELVEADSGWLVPAGDVDALSRAMRICLEAPVDVLNRMGDAAYKRVLARHFIDRQAERLAELFNSVVQKNMNSSDGEKLQLSEPVHRDLEG
jgi:colanic acid/amylovoran biosynthesis glycosyltransferase